MKKMRIQVARSEYVLADRNIVWFIGVVDIRQIVTDSPYPQKKSQQQNDAKEYRLDPFRQVLTCTEQDTRYFLSFKNEKILKRL